MMMVMMISFAKIIMTIINLKGRDDHDDGHDELFFAKTVMIIICLAGRNHEDSYLKDSDKVLGEQRGLKSLSCGSKVVLNQ